MYQTSRALDSQNIKWSSFRSEPKGCIYYFEGRQVSSSQTETTSHQHREGYLQDSEIEPWLRREGNFAPSPEQGDHKGDSQGFRLLVCERSGWVEASLPLSEKSFTCVEESFNLSPLTLSSIFKHTGTYTKRYRRDPDTRQIESVDIVMKVTGQYEISDALLSLNHNYSRRWTTAFLCGHGMLHSLTERIDREFGKHFDYISGSIKACGSFWDHALFLPTVIIQDSCRRTQVRQLQLSAQMAHLESSIGITRAGRVRPGNLTQWPGGIDFKTVTLELHSAGPQIISASYMAAWIADCTRFLLDIKPNGSPTGLQPSNAKTHSDSDEDASLVQQLEYELNTITGVERYLSGYQERLRAQITVLLSASAQSDTAQTIKLGVLTKRDSVAMMAFTFITALFLPGTAVATLFSMPMFDWDNDESSTDVGASDGLVSVTSGFWVYWAVTAPLTVMVMAGWYAWYVYKNWDWQRKMELQVLNEIKPVGA